MKRLVILLVTSAIVASCGSNNANHDATGMFEATEVMVSAEGNGKLLTFNVTEGEEVLSTTELGCIDTMQLYLTKVQLQQSKEQVGSLRQDIPKQIAALEEQLAYQRRELARVEQLIAANVGNAKQKDDITAQILILERQLAATKDQLEKGNRGVNDQEGAVDAQIAALDDQLQKCRVQSPIAGTVLSKYAEPGEMVSVGRPLFKVANLEEIFLRAYITSAQLTEMQLGQTVKVYADFGEKGSREYEGVVNWIASEAEFTPKTIQTKDERGNLVYAVKIAVKNDGYLKIGMYGDVVLK